MTLKKLVFNSIAVFVLSLVILYFTINGTLPDILAAPFAIVAVISFLACAWALIALMQKKEAAGDEKTPSPKKGSKPAE